MGNVRGGAEAEVEVERHGWGSESDWLAISEVGMVARDRRRRGWEVCGKKLEAEAVWEFARHGREKWAPLLAIINSSPSTSSSGYFSRLGFLVSWPDASGFT